MTSKIFKFNIYRTLSLWVVPLLLLAFICFVFLVDQKSVWHMKAIEVTAWSLFLLFTVGIFTFLFFNHLSFAIKTQIVVEAEEVFILQNGNSYKFKIDDIQKIVEYSIDNKYTTGKLPWGSIMKWKLITSREQLYISSLTISKDDFKKYFKKDFTYSLSYFPTV